MCGKNTSWIATREMHYKYSDIQAALSVLNAISCKQQLNLAHNAEKYFRPSFFFFPKNILPAHYLVINARSLSQWSVLGLSRLVLAYSHQPSGPPWAMPSFPAASLYTAWLQGLSLGNTDKNQCRKREGVLMHSLTPRLMFTLMYAKWWKDNRLYTISPIQKKLM